MRHGAQQVVVAAAEHGHLFGTSREACWQAKSTSRLPAFQHSTATGLGSDASQPPSAARSRFQSGLGDVPGPNGVDRAGVAALPERLENACWCVST